MSEKKVITKLNFTQINALSDSGLELFTNSFSYHEDDYFHKNIGSLFGVIQVSDHSKNSEYIPNLLTSIIKKSFYSHTKKITEENFELALKKVNLALADLAEHEIVEWNKNLHALVGVFDKDNLLFTQVGNALILLCRDDKVMNLSEPTTLPSIHPIKTFKDIVIGRIQPGDKIIVATPTILNIFDINALDRLFNTFSTKEFDAIFFKTLKKEGENISAVVINVTEKKQRDYSANKSLTNEHTSVEELTGNKNFLGSVPKSKKIKKSKVTPDKISNNESVGRIKKTTSIINPTKNNILLEKESISTSAIPKNKTLNFTTPKESKQSQKLKKSTKTISKKQALDQAQKNTTTSTKRISKKQQDITSSNIISTNPKESSSLKNSTKVITDKSKQLPLEKNIAPKIKIKNPLSSVNKSENTHLIDNKKKITKLNDLKTPEKKKTFPEISPFEKLHDIYIKDDNINKKINKSSSRKLKKYFNTSNLKKKSAATTTSKSLLPTDTPNKKNKSAAFNEYSKKEVPSSRNKSLNSEFKKDTKITTSTKFDYTKYIQNTTISIKTATKKTTTFFIKNTALLKKLILKNYSTNKPSSVLNDTSYGSTSKSLSTHSKKNIDRLFHFVRPYTKKIILLSKKHSKIFLLILFIVLTPIIIGIIITSKKKEETVKKIGLIEELPNITTSQIENKNKINQIASLPTTIKLLAGNANILLVYTDDSQIYEINKETRSYIKLNIPTKIALSDIKAINYITSLNLFFLSSNTMIVSYSPKVHKFIENKISLPNNFNLVGQNTYLSYLYLLDDSSKQIYRYPRAPGGFTSSKKWLYKPLTHDAKISAMAIDENIRITYTDGIIEKYSRGKLLTTKQFNLKSLDFIDAPENSKNYYLLSKQDGKILKINKSSDEIEKEYENNAIQNTTTFNIDEKNNSIYIFDNKKIFSITL